MNFCLHSRNRLCSSQDFENAFRHRGNSNKWFTVYIVDSKHPYARLGMVVSKRIVPRAVDRNQIKRLIRETFRLHQSRLGNQDYIVRIRRFVDEKALDEVRAALLQLLLDTKTL